ncbi:MAG: DUF4124 domain-containing protein [Sedimenticola sp.]
MRFQAFAVAVALTVTAFHASAQVYRWVDEDGVTIYSQTRPAGGGEVTEIKTATPRGPAAASSSPTERLDKQREQSDAAKEKAESDALKREYEAEQAKARSTNCQAARHNLQLYQTLGNKIVKRPDGTYKRYTETERQAKIAEMEKQIEQFCK